MIARPYWSNGASKNLGCAFAARSLPPGSLEFISYRAHLMKHGRFREPWFSKFGSLCLVSGSCRPAQATPLLCLFLSPSIDQPNYAKLPNSPNSFPFIMNLPMLMMSSVSICSIAVVAHFLFLSTFFEILILFALINLPMVYLSVIHFTFLKFIMLIYSIFQG